MSNDIDIRTSLPGDIEPLEVLYPAAFPDEDLLPVVRALLSEKGGVFSFVATGDGKVIGHIAFTMCALAGHSEKVGLLAPLAVSPRHQKQGIGSALIRTGLKTLKNERTAVVYVLGDPAYYGRFGFTQENNVKPPYDLPQDWQTAWQSLSLREATPVLNGRLSVPEPWRHPELWAE